MNASKKPLIKLAKHIIKHHFNCGRKKADSLIWRFRCKNKTYDFTDAAIEYALRLEVGYEK